MIPSPAREDAMCYSKDWQADVERKRQAAKTREKRAGVIDTLRTEAEKEAEKAKRNVPQTVPAK